MPWQAAPSLIIIFGAFNVAAGLIWTVDRCYYGKVRVGSCWKVGSSPAINQWCRLVEMVYLVGEFVRLSCWHTFERIGFRDSETIETVFFSPYFYQR